MFSILVFLNKNTNNLETRHPIKMCYNHTKHTSMNDYWSGVFKGLLNRKSFKMITVSKKKYIYIKHMHKKVQNKFDCLQTFCK